MGRGMLRIVPIPAAMFTDRSLARGPAHPLDAQEHCTGGRYAVMRAGADTLGTWTARDRPIGDRDIVAWYTPGFHHITRTEDWPVMPTHGAGFSLMPHNFSAQ